MTTTTQTLVERARLTDEEIRRIRKRLSDVMLETPILSAIAIEESVKAHQEAQLAKALYTVETWMMGGGQVVWPTQKEQGQQLKYMQENGKKLKYMLEAAGIERPC